MEYAFAKAVSTSQLLSEIAGAGLPAPARVDTLESVVTIFYDDALSGGQEATLGTVVSNHVIDPNFGQTSTQQNIDKLLGYLNNVNPSIANTARAVILRNLAPNLPPGLMSTINAQIQAIVGS